MRIWLAMLLCACGQREDVASPSLPPCADPPHATAAERELFMLAYRQRDVRAEPPVPGPMTEQYARAKRLFDSERWEVALPRLEQVAAGASDDDPGNRQIAAYQVGICRQRIGYRREAIEAFGSIALDRSHLRHRESLLWLVKLAESGDVPAVYFVNFDLELVKRFDNPNQRDLLGRAAYLVGLAKLLAGSAAEAATLFELARPSVPKARECLWLAQNGYGQLRQDSR